MSQQYLRNLSLIVANAAGKGLELGSLRVTFHVARGDRQTPNTLDVSVWNLSDATADRLRTPEFTQVQLAVSYGDPAQNPPQLIFRGSIKQVRHGREDQLNSYVAITAADGDEAINFSFAALTLAAGSTDLDGIKAMIAAMARQAAGAPTGGSGGQQVTQGYIPELSTDRSVRGRTYFGLCRDHLRHLANNADCVWSIQDGAVTFIPNTGYIPGAPVLITPSTGLIGVPEVTQNGLEMTVLMNPNIKIGQTVKLEADLNQIRFNLDLNSAPTNALLAQTAAKLNGSGLYYVMYAEHTGDTRGTAWYTKLTCLAVDASIPPSAIQRAAVVPADAVPRY